MMTTPTQTLPNQKSKSVKTENIANATGPTPPTRQLVLIVDEDLDCRHRLSQFVRACGMSAVSVPDGLEALVFLDKNSVDMVITNSEVPLFSGIDLLKYLSRKMPFTPVIVTSDDPDAEDATLCMRFGAIDYVSKPFQAHAISRAVNTAIQRARSISLPRKQECIEGYRVLDFLGEGALGTVWLVTSNNEHYALKLLKDFNLSADQLRSTVNRFCHEAQATMRLSHPNIIKLFDYGFTYNHKIPFLVMELLKGGDYMQTWIKEARPMIYATKAAILLQAAEALEELERHGIVHRDIKPANLYISGDLQLKVTDFSLAHMPDSHLTQPEHLFGTPAYMSPEALFGATFDHRSDIFSFGSTAYEFLTKKPAFEGETAFDLIGQICDDHPLEPHSRDAGFPPPLQAILARTLRKDLDERYQSAGDIASDLRAYLDDAPISPDTTSNSQDWRYKA